MAVPKNYITSGINKNLLTPCRRIGLSRSKKTPKNVNTSPLIANPNLVFDKTTPNKSIEVESKVDLKETPKQFPALKKDKKKIDRIDVHNDLNNPVEVDQSPEVTNVKLDSYKVCIKPNETITPKIEKKNSLKDSPTENIATKILVKAEIHHPVAKRSINFNRTDGSSIISSKTEKKSEPDNNRTDGSSIISSKTEKKSELDKNSSITPLIAEKHTLCHQIEEEPEENNFKSIVIKSKKRKLRLDDDDFASNENLLEHKNSLETSITPKIKTIKKSHTTLKEGNNTLGRFTTEDYLKEYSSNPERFEENLERDDLVGATFKDEDDMEAFSTFSNKVKIRSIKSADKSTTNSPSISKNNYVAILYPSLDQSVDNTKLKHSISTKGSSLEQKAKLKKVLTAESKTKQKLTISLERLNSKDLTSILKSDGNERYQIEDLSSTRQLIRSKTAHLKTNEFDEDDGLFTSSPENDKKQRENLLQLILSIEIEIKRKQEKLEKLKQAQVYKKKHSPEKLKVSSDRWLQGCRAGLNDFLVKMREHGPMEMDTLTKKLRISDDIVEKLQL